MTGRKLDGHFYPAVVPDSETNEDELSGPPGEGPPERHPVMLVFRDGFGRRWVRWPDGRLTRYSPCLAQVEPTVRTAWRRLQAARR